MSAIKRIQKDILEWRESSRHFHNIAAEPFENDMFTWHFNILVGSRSVALHGQIQFPRNYPFSPPRVSFFGNVPHQQVRNVSMGHVARLCLDMLQESNQGYYSGWSSAYSVVSIFAQIETLLHSLSRTQISQYWSSFSCRQCGHNGAESSGYLPAPGALVAVADEEKTSVEDGVRVWQLLNADVESVIFSFLSQTDLQRLVVVDFHIQQVLYSLRVYHWSTVECYHSHCTFGDFCSLIGQSGMLRDVVLKNVFGIGFKTEYWDNDGNEVLNNLHMSPDLLSFGAFSDGVNFSMWRDFEFTEFLPLYLNNEHGSYALPLAEAIIKKCYHVREATPFSPVLALRFLSKLMNTTVVSLMNEVEDQSDKVHLFTSTKALQSYLYCYHLLLGFAKKYPGIVGYARTKVNDFLEKPDKRNKKHYPDLGEFLVYLALVEYAPWSRFGPVFVEEAFTRNAKWILEEHPSLITTHRNLEVSCVRLRKSWEVSMVGKRLQMFQYYFMKNVCGVSDETGMSDLDAKLHFLNRSLGQVPEYVAVDLQRRCRVIFQVDDWMQYYELINLPSPSAQRLSHMMRMAMVESDRKGYHRHVETPVGDAQPHEDSNLCLCSGTIFDIATRDRQMAAEAKEAETKEDDDERRYLDVAFSLDCTGSMWSYLNSVKEHIQQIADTLSNEGNIDVQFAIVGYRDHGYTENWPKVTKTHDFANVKKFKKNLTKYTCGGGGPPEEAVPDSWHQILALNWRRFSVKAVIHVADIACHGLETPSDECPAGHDPIDLARQMLMSDITLYNVGCKMWSDEHKDFYSGTAHTTGGVYLPLANSDKLPQLIVESTREGMSLSSIIPKVHGLMKKYRQERPYATRDQLVYFVWRDLVEQKIVTRKVRCVEIDNEISDRVFRISKAENLAECRAILLETPEDESSDDEDSTSSPVVSIKSSPKPTGTGPTRRSGSVNKFKTYDEYAKDLQRKQRQAKRARARRRKRGQTKQAARDEETRRLEEEKQALKEVVSLNDRLITFEQTLRCLNRAEQMGNRLEWMEKGCVYRMEKYSAKAARQRHAERGLEYSGKLVRIRRLKFQVGDKVEYKDAKKQRIYAAEVSKLDRANFSIIVRVSGLRNAKRTVSMTSRNLTKFGRFLTAENLQNHHSGVIDRRLSDEVRDEVIAERRTGRKVVQAVPEASVRVQIGISRKDTESSDLLNQIEKSNAPKFAQMATLNEEEEKDFAVANVTSRDIPVSRPTSVPHKYSLTRRDMVVKSALCIIPPMDLWGPIQEIRRVHDKSYDRWMPHINILYPYAPVLSFPLHVPHLRGALRARCMRPFRVELCGYDYFDKKPRADDPDPSVYVFLKTRVVRGEPNSWDLLMDVIKRVYPKYDMGQSSFQPHLTVAQVPRSQVRSFVSDLNGRLVPSQFDVHSVCLISRAGYSSAFAVDHVVRF